jgi:hypothetical protein
MFISEWDGDLTFETGEDHISPHSVCASLKNVLCQMLALRTYNRPLMLNSLIIFSRPQTLVAIVGTSPLF